MRPLQARHRRLIEATAVAGQDYDAHVRVASACGEVEVFAHKTGQIRVRCDGPGTIDGKPFTGEHPVEAGVPIVAAGIGLVLLPWR